MAGNSMKQSIKVLLIITLSETGGAQKVVYNIAAGLEAQLFNVTVACAPGGELVHWLRQLPQNIRVVELPEFKRNINPFFDFLVLLRLYWLIRQERFDIVHCHSSKAGVLGRLAAWLSGVPKIFFTVHGWGINEYQRWPVRFFYTWMERLVGLISTNVICVSESNMLKALSLKLVTEKKLCLIYNGLPELKKTEGDLRRELNLTEEDIIIGTVARLAPPKDLLLFLEVAEQVIKHNNSETNKGHIYFIIIGDGPLRPECEKFIADNDLKSNVLLLGTREEAAELVQEFDIFVLFSRWEGLPLTIIEAMMAGRPVVANAVGGASGNWFTHKKAGCK
jgi:glycosyltransferase involved in cell wall biosynthesis